MHGAQNTLNTSILSKCTSTRAYAPGPMQWCIFLPWNNCELILSLTRASFRLLFSARPAPVSTKSVFQLCSLKKSVQIHSSYDTIADVALHKHHLIICVGAGLIQFVYGFHSKRGHGIHFIKNSIFPIFSREFFG